MSRSHKRLTVGDAVMPLSSMIDIVFLLLIYFIVTQKIIVEDTLLNASIPGGKPDTAVTVPQSSLLVIDIALMNAEDPARDLDTFMVNRRRCSYADLREQLLHLGTLASDTTVFLRCGPNPPHRKLVRVLDACKEADLNNLQIVNDEGQSFTPEKYARHYQQGAN
jgi:biopolymer transport protein ExbD